MEKKESNQKKNYIDFVEIFRSISLERKFTTGEILSSFEYPPEEVFLIKEGGARLISKINGKLTSIAKLSKGDFIGIASILNGISLEEVRASEELIVYSIKNQEFQKLYKEKLAIKKFCDNKIWASEIFYVLKNFPKLYKRNLFISTNLLDQVSLNSKLIPADLNSLNNCLKKSFCLLISLY